MLYDQASLNDFVRQLYLSITKSLLAASNLKQRSFLQPGVNVNYYKDRYKAVLPFIGTHSNGTPYVKDIPGLFRWFGIEYFPQDWRCNIDSNVTDLKASLLDYNQAR